MSAARQRSLQLADGGALVLRVYESARQARASVVIGGAMGVPQAYYASYAQWLAEQGYRVWTFDYRGHGESQPNTPGHTLRGFRADLFDWARDYELVVSTARRELPGCPLYLVGHSLGGQLPGLFNEPALVDGMLSIGAGSGYWRDNAPALRRRALLLWYTIAPVLTWTFGYFPGRRLGMVGDLPAGVIRQWRSWCLNPRYSVGVEGAAVAQQYALARFPILSWFIADDELMTLRGTRTLLALYTGAPHQLQTITPADVPVPRIGHFGFFRETFRTTLWPRAMQALDAFKSDAVSHTTDKAPAGSQTSIQ
jgi:predicted alpha/beta hydrolase